MISRALPMRSPKPKITDSRIAIYNSRNCPTVSPVLIVFVVPVVPAEFIWFLTTLGRENTKLL